MRRRQPGFRELSRALAIAIALTGIICPVPGRACAHPDDSRGETVCELVFAPDEYEAFFNGDPVAMDSAPYIEQNAMMVPFRLIGEALGASISWDPATREVSFRRPSDGKCIVLRTGDTSAVVDGKITTMNVPPAIRDGRTFVPLRFVSENMDATVSWDGVKRTASVLYSSPSACIESDGIRVLRPLPQAVCWPVGVRTAKIVIDVTNLRNETALLAFKPEAETHVDGWLVIMHPQGSNLYLKPGETGRILATVEPGPLDPGQKRIDGARLELPVTITDHDRLIATVNAQVIFRDKEDLQRTCVIRGKIADISGKPVGDAHVIAHLWNEMGRYECASDAAGGYRALLPPASALHAKKLVLSVDAPGYEYVSTVIDYPLGQREIVQDIALIKAAKGPPFALEKEVDTGFGVWRFDGSRDGRYIVSSPGVHADVPRSPAMNAHLFDPFGNVIWSRDVGDQAWGVSCSQDGGLLAFGGLNRRAIVLDRSGETVLDYPLDYCGESREVRLSDDGSRLGIGTVSGRFLLVDTRTGNLLWSYMTYGQVRGIAFRGNRVFVGAGDNNLYAFTLSGTLLWKRPIVAFPLFLGAAEDGSLIVASGKSQEAIAYDWDGNLLWRRALDHNITSGAVAREGSIIVLYSVSGNLWAFDREGGLIFRRHMGRFVHNGVAISPGGGYIAVGTDTGVYLLNRNGTVVWSHSRVGPKGEVGGPHGANALWLAPDLSALIVGYEDGAVEAFRSSIAIEGPRP